MANLYTLAGPNEAVSNPEVQASAAERTRTRQEDVPKARSRGDELHR